MSERIIQETLRHLVSSPVGESPQLVLPDTPPPFNSPIMTTYPSTEPFQQLFHSTNEYKFKKLALYNPRKAIRRFRGRVHQDLAIGERQVTPPFHTTVIGPNRTLEFIAEHIQPGAGRKRYPLGLDCVNGTYTPDALDIEDMAGSLKISRVIEASIAEDREYYEDKFLDFMRFQDENSQYFAYSALAFLVPNKFEPPIRPRRKVLEFEETSYEIAEFDDYIDYLTSLCPTVQQARDLAMR
jgi:hypothetical protein